jgi:hypothetical protein
MEWLDSNVAAAQSSLKECPEIFNFLGVNLSRALGAVGQPLHQVVQGVSAAPNCTQTAGKLAIDPSEQPAVGDYFVISY